MNAINIIYKFEFVSLQGSILHKFRDEIRMLKKLRYLDLRWINMSKSRDLTIRPGVISSLSQLEELYLGDGLLRNGRSKSCMSKFR